MDGLVRKLFTTPEELAAFEKTAQYAEIQTMLGRLRERGDHGEGKEPTRVITVRLPKSLHESLQGRGPRPQDQHEPACITKLLQVIDGEIVPAE